ncbi:PREDICTED: uncharacterized protein LOC105145296 [Acromyrmex echinatior]|uniref:uncharacterized protein LOC105145296 n=1 Tax=Acromyrmex echinatior TaxID=103372 RepID=UPI000580FD7D|nr:PREDICTED: uncharacterized protein LOC105145296 [Acromyrmex echinatior]
MEHILYRRLSWYNMIKSRPILSRSQSGFRPFGACDDNLTTLITSVRTDFLNQSPTAAVFLDIVGVFDNVDSHILLEDLREIGVPALFRKFVENLISIRHLNFVIDDELYGPYDAYKDTPKGGLH